MGRRQPPRSLKLVVEHFKPLKDPRIDRTKLHPLENILVMTLSASICGAEGWDEIARFTEAREGWYATFLDMPGGTPSADTSRRLFERLSPVKFEECFRSWVDALAEGFAGEVVAIDGKTLRGAVEKAGKKTQLHMVHVWATEQNLLLAQQSVEGGASGEMAAIPKLLKVLDLEGAIVERERFAADRKHTEIDEAHGRKETRVVTVLEPEDWPWKTKNNGEWAGLRTAARIERSREVIGGKTSAEVQYFVSSLPPDAERIAEAIRAHWSIENNLHWSLDVAFGDDRRRVRDAQAAENLATVDRIALMLLKHAPARTARKLSVRMSRKVAAWDVTYAAEVQIGRAHV